MNKAEAHTLTKPEESPVSKFPLLYPRLAAAQSRDILSF